jgi:hypothetical protein
LTTSIPSTSTFGGCSSRTKFIFGIADVESACVCALLVGVAARGVATTCYVLRCTSQAAAVQVIKAAASNLERFENGPEFKALRKAMVRSAAGGWSVALCLEDGL